MGPETLFKTIIAQTPIEFDVLVNAFMQTPNVQFDDITFSLSTSSINAPGGFYTFLGEQGPFEPQQSSIQVVPLLMCVFEYRQTGP